MDNDEVKKCCEMIRNINSPEDIRIIANLARQRKKDIEKKQANKIGWSVGQTVVLKEQHQHRKPYDEVGVITKVNRVKLKITFADSGGYVVPKTMVKIVYDKDRV